MRPVGCKDRLIDLKMFLYNITFVISVAVLVAFAKRILFLLVFVVLYNRRSIFIIQLTVIQSFGVCLQINCVVTKDPGTHCFLFLTGTQWSLTGTHDFSQDESQDGP